MATGSELIDRLNFLANSEGGGAVADALYEAAEMLATYERALGKIAGAEGCQPGHVAYLGKTTMCRIADTALNGERAVSA